MVCPTYCAMYTVLWGAVCQCHFALRIFILYTEVYSITIPCQTIQFRLPNTCPLQFRVPNTIPFTELQFPSPNCNSETKLQFVQIGIPSTKLQFGKMELQFGMTELQFGNARDCNLVSELQFGEGNCNSVNGIVMDMYLVDGIVLSDTELLLNTLQ